MPFPLNPAPGALGIAAPVLGPWFWSTAGGQVTLPAPAAGGTLGLPLAIPVGMHWLPPAAGTLSLFVTPTTPSPAPPPRLAHLRDGTGAHPFTQQGALVAYFEILPEVAARLDELLGLLPPVTGQPIAAPPGPAVGVIPAPRRARVRSFALELPPICATTGGITNLVQGTPPGNDLTAQLRAVGLRQVVPNGGTAVANGPAPMTWLRRPGTYAIRNPITGAALSPERDELLHDVGAMLNPPMPAGTATLWAFDARGRAIDPGAVAAWWSWLLTDAVGDAAGGGGTNWQLLPAGLTVNDYPLMQPGSAQRAVCAYLPGHAALFVDPHDAPLAPGGVFLGNRLVAQAPGAAAPQPVAAAFYPAAPGPAGHALSFTGAPATGGAPPDNPPPDDAPLPRLAVLPDGSAAGGATPGYQPTLTLWPGGWPGAGAAALVRDFVRVAVVDEEYHLLGVRRGPSRIAENAPAPARRSADQNRPSTRTVVARTADQAPVLLAGADAVAQRVVGLYTPAAPTRAVLGVGDLAWGPAAGGLMARPAPAPGTSPAFPTQLAEQAGAGALPADSFRVRALGGGGSTASEPQAVLVEVQLGAPGAGNPHANTWIRAWPLGFDPATGTRARLTGGAGRVDATGLARLVVTLPPGRVDPVGRLGMELLAARLAPSGTPEERTWADVRFDRPAPIGGALVSAAAPPAGAQWHVCETGAALGPGALAGAVPSGGTVVLVAGQPQPAIVDRTTLAAVGAWNGTLATVLAPAATPNAGNVVSLTEPAYLATADRADAIGRPVAREAASPADATGGLAGALGTGLHYTPRLGGPTIDPLAPFQPSSPLPLQERLEVAAATVNGGGATAVLGGAPPLPWVHDVGAGWLGHPGAPAAVEIAGTGVALTGTPALAVVEHVRERTAGMGLPGVRGLAPTAVRDLLVGSDLALAAEVLDAPLLPSVGNDGIPAVAPPGSVGTVAAVLRTVAARQEGQPAVWQAIPDAESFVPLSQTDDALSTRLANWLDAVAASWTAWLAAKLPAGTTLPPLPPAVQTPGTALDNATQPTRDQLARALDRRVQATRGGRRELAVALDQAFQRAQDLVYVETPMLDGDPHGPGDDQLNPWQRLVTRVTQAPALCVLLCVPSRLLPGAPRQLHDVRDEALLAAIQAMRVAAGSRFAVFSPGAGAGRARRLATTTVVVDDVLAYTGTTHLGRRGLTFDASLAAAVFDERVADGRSAEVLAFRRALVADRLGVPVGRVPDDPLALVRAVTQLDAQGSVRLSAQPILPPASPTEVTQRDVWNPDGLNVAPGVPAPPVTLEGVMSLLQLTGSAHAVAEP
jgi:hypothetical protein